LFSLNSTVLLIFLFESKYLLYVPFLFRTGSFFYYLVMPSFYLYTVFVLKSRKHLRWTDALHGLPALIYLIDFAPLFFSSIMINCHVHYCHDQKRCFITMKAGSCHTAYIS
jgi:hypothetical protein